MKEILNVRNYVESMFEYFKHKENFEGVNYDSCKDIIKRYFANEKMLSLRNYASVYANSFNISEDKVKKIIIKFHHLAMHPVRIDKCNKLSALLDSIKDENNYVSFDRIKSIYGDDYEHFLIAFNSGLVPYTISDDESGLKRDDKNTDVMVL